MGESKGIRLFRFRSVKKYSSHPENLLETVQKKNSTTTYRGRQKFKITVNGSLSPGRRPLDPLGQGTREGTAVLADKVSLHHCARFSSIRLHRKSRFHGWLQNFTSETLSTPRPSSEDSSQKCLQIKAAAAGLIEERRDTCFGGGA